MGKRQEIRAKRARQKMLNRIWIILLVTVGAIFLAFALALPAINTASITATQLAAMTAAPGTQIAALTQMPINTITPRIFSVPSNRTSLGDPNAPVRIDVWEDFQCVACKTFFDRYESQVIENYVETGKAYYTIHFFPIISQYTQGNNESMHSSNASLCAADQGKFWEYHDILFANWNGENAGAYADYRLVAFAESIGLDMEEFNACFIEDRHFDQIEADFQEGIDLGLNGTPSVLVNGTVITPGYVATFEAISEAIEAILAEE